MMKTSKSSIQKSKSDKLNSTFASLEKVLQDQKKDLEDSERELERERQSFQNEIARFGGSEAKSSDVLNLNVGGIKMVVLRRTLMYEPKSMLASKFSGR